MSTLRETLDDLANSLRERPDEILLEVGAGGELLVARLRVVVAGLLILLPVPLKPLPAMCWPMAS